MNDVALVRGAKPQSDPLGEPAHRSSGIGPRRSISDRRLAFDELHRQIGSIELRIDREDEITDDRFVVQAMKLRGLVAK